MDISRRKLQHMIEMHKQKRLMRFLSGVKFKWNPHWACTYLESLCNELVPLELNPDEQEVVDFLTTAYFAEKNYGQQLD